MGVVLVEGISDRIALEAAAVRLGRDLVADEVELVAIGGAQAVARAVAEHPGMSVAGLCDVGEERYFRRALGAGRVEGVLATQGDLETFRNFQNQPAWRGRPVEAQLRRWFHAADRRNTRYPPLLVAALDPDEIPFPLRGVLAAF